MPVPYDGRMLSLVVVRGPDRGRAFPLPDREPQLVGRSTEALELSDHGYVLETGHIVLDGPYQTLLADDRVRRSYLGLTEE